MGQAVLRTLFWGMNISFLFVIRRRQRYIWNIVSKCNAEAHVWNINLYPKGSAIESKTPCKIGCWPKNKLARVSPDFVKYISPITPLQSSACANCCLSYAIQVRILSIESVSWCSKKKWNIYLALTFSH